MEYLVKSANPEKQRTACIAVGVYEAKSLTNSASKIDSASEGYINSILKKGDFQGKIGQTCLLYNIPGIEAERVMLVGLGKVKEFDAINFIKAQQSSFDKLKSMGTADCISFLTEIDIPGYDLFWKIRHSVVLCEESNYSFTEYKSAKDSKNSFKKLTLAIPTKRELKKSEQAISQGISISQGAKLMKDLANTPPNICTPTYLAKASQKLAKEFKKVNCAVLNEKEMNALGMGALLAVAKGSKQPPKLISLEYRGNRSNKNPIVFVGKGITFDTGGNSIKPREGMIGMKYDMSGAAAVLGIIKFAASLELPLNIVGIVPSAENMLGSQAYRPEDIVKTMSGQTVEVLNTDAEGRLILCDALTYCERFNPSVVIDIATLTGACIIALGSQHSGVFSNDDTLAQDLVAAGQYINDKCWQLPISKEYHEQLDSTYADMANIGGAGAGAITAACFLSKFANKFKWAHLDIAGSSITPKGKTKASTGRPIPLLAQYLINSSEN